MSGSKWIQMSSCLILVLRIKAASTVPAHLTVRVGDDVTLSVDNQIPDQLSCNGTTWLFSQSNRSPAVELVNLGQILKGPNSDRLSVSGNCSLVVKSVTVKDAGQYSYRHFKGSQLDQSAEVYLSVAHIVTDSVAMTAKCTVLSYGVLTYGRCEHTVEWLNQEVKVQSWDVCSAAVSFDTQGTEKSLKCRVTDAVGAELLLCSAPSLSCEETDPIRDDPQWWRYIAVAAAAAVAVAAAAAAAALLIRHRRNKRREPQEEDHPEDGVSYATVTFLQKSGSGSGEDRAPGADEGDEVTYSSVCRSLQ